MRISDWSSDVCFPIYAAQHAVAGVDVKPDFLGGHVRSPGSLSGVLLGGGLDDHAQDVGFLHDHEVLATELDLAARPLAEQHPVAGFDVELVQFAVLVANARADADQDRKSPRLNSSH